MLTACAPLCIACDTNGPDKCDATKCISASVYNSATQKCDGKAPLHTQSILTLVYIVYLFFPYSCCFLFFCSSDCSSSCLFIFIFLFVHLVVFLFNFFLFLVVVFCRFFFFVFIVTLSLLPCFLSICFILLVYVFLLLLLRLLLLLVSFEVGVS